MKRIKRKGYRALFWGREETEESQKDIIKNSNRRIVQQFLSREINANGWERLK